jgi:hypothetical protein
VSWLEELDRELRALGVPRSERKRILFELEDHLRSSKGETVELGDPEALAQEFADELATAESRRAALVGFAALAAAGIGFALCLVTGALAGSPDIGSAEIMPLGMLAALVMLLAPQVAFAAGLLALLGAVRTRRARIVPAADATLGIRRTAIALAAGAASLSALALYAIEYRAGLSTWWTVTAVTTAAGLTVPLALAATRVRRAAGIRSAVEGDAGDVFDDLPIRVPRRPWALCVAVALLAAVATGVAGGLDEGPRNAVFEALAVVAGFVVLGRALGLRPRSR